MGIYDLDKIEGNLILKLADKDEDVICIGGHKDRIKVGELLVRDNKNIVDSFRLGAMDRIKVDFNTKNVLLLAYKIPGISEEKVIDAVNDATDRIIRLSDGKKIENT